MGLKKKIILGVAVILIGIQFFQPLRNQSEEVTEAHFEKVYAVPQNIKAILVRSCYDCHSNNTRYPWYGRIQPGAWYMADHIRKGKQELNFSEFGDYSQRRKRSKLRSIAGQIKDGEMPLSSYTLIHRDAAISEEDRRTLTQWFEAMEDSDK
ncbi:MULTISPECIES: heme-binding domain-containing protein [Bacteroidota]|uniref:Heme-binding domain-containing protein n=1 Tax=Sphingobacterium hotanense TaxID=649196 RepID=A0ABT7NHN0_9SPHI|nr:MULTISPECIES: heme-binding domain-containing protein [Bacteroidota]MDM1046694.1 heme-binding domain-containing protein [Sphingobacterium hotanense]